MGKIETEDTDYEMKRAQALRWRMFREYLSCAYCGKLLSWRWKFFHGFGFGKHRLITGACQCESIGGHPIVILPAAMQGDKVRRVADAIRVAFMKQDATDGVSAATNGYIDVPHVDDLEIARAAIKALEEMNDRR